MHDSSNNFFLLKNLKKLPNILCWLFGIGFFGGKTQLKAFLHQFVLLHRFYYVTKGIESKPIGTFDEDGLYHWNRCTHFFDRWIPSWSYTQIEKISKKKTLKKKKFIRIYVNTSHDLNFVILCATRFTHAWLQRKKGICLNSLMALVG